MPVSDAEIVRTVIKGTLDDGSSVMNRKTWKADFESDVAGGTLVTKVELWVEELYGEVAADIDANVVFELCDVFVIEWNAVTEIWEVARQIGSYTPSVTFTNIADALPNQVSAFLIGETERPKSRGRFFVFPFGEDAQDHGEITAGVLTHLGNMLVDYIGDIEITANHELISGIVREGVNLFLPFAAGAVNDILGTQRSRRFNVGI